MSIVSLFLSRGIELDWFTFFGLNIGNIWSQIISFFAYLRSQRTAVTMWFRRWQQQSGICWAALRLWRSSRELSESISRIGRKTIKMYLDTRKHAPGCCSIKRQVQWIVFRFSNKGPFSWPTIVRILIVRISKYNTSEPNGDYSKHPFSVFTSGIYFKTPNASNPLNPSYFLRLFFSDRVITKIHSQSIAIDRQRVLNAEVGLQFDLIDKWHKYFSSPSQGAAIDAELPNCRRGTKNSLHDKRRWITCSWNFKIVITCFVY